MELLPAEAVRLTGATALVDATPRIKLNSIKLWIGLNQRCKWGHYSYFNLPERYRPFPLNFISIYLTNKKENNTPETTRKSLLYFYVC